jgi:hypothetical protein
LIKLEFAALPISLFCAAHFNIEHDIVNFLLQFVVFSQVVLRVNTFIRL